MKTVVATLRAQDFPEQAVIGMPAAVVADDVANGFRHAGQSTHQIFDRLGGQIRMGFERLVDVVDVSLMVLAVMDQHGRGVDVRLQRIMGIRQVGK